MSSATTWTRTASSSSPPAENDQLDRAVLSGLRTAAVFLDVALRNAVGHAIFSTRVH
ncbi:hypothetical protein [Streptomyces sp. NPDC088760]|uniref:hypothetical protein n=1 Tax=Streptomyces sp. NPDC088760 TaxID=3365890 RepID=UPI003829CCD4